jgi:uncharacterized protein
MHVLRLPFELDDIARCREPRAIPLQLSRVCRSPAPDAISSFSWHFGCSPMPRREIERAQGGTVAKEDRGFASMDRARQREIASKGGKAAHQKGTAHEWTSEEARDAGRKGGLASHRRRREQKDPQGMEGGDTGMSGTREPSMTEPE